MTVVSDEVIEVRAFKRVKDLPFTLEEASILARDTENTFDAIAKELEEEGNVDVDFLIGANAPRNLDFAGARLFWDSALFPLDALRVFLESVDGILSGNRDVEVARKELEEEEFEGVVIFEEADPDFNTDVLDIGDTLMFADAKFNKNAPRPGVTANLNLLSPNPESTDFVKEAETLADFGYTEATPLSIDAGGERRRAISLETDEVDGIDMTNYFVMDEVEMSIALAETKRVSQDILDR